MELHLHFKIFIGYITKYCALMFFIGQKINSMKRLFALNEELIKELIPQIGLRAGFLYSWKRLVVSVFVCYSRRGIICH